MLMMYGAFFLVWFVHLFAPMIILRFLFCFGCFVLFRGFQMIRFSEVHVLLVGARKRVRAILICCQALHFGHHSVFLGGSRLLRFGWIFLNGGGVRYLLGKVSGLF